MDSLGTKRQVQKPLQHSGCSEWWRRGWRRRRDCRHIIKVEGPEGFRYGGWWCSYRISLGNWTIIPGIQGQPKPSRNETSELAEPLEFTRVDCKWLQILGHSSYWEEVTVCPPLESGWALWLLDQESTTVPASELEPWDSDSFYFPICWMRTTFGVQAAHEEAPSKRYQAPGQLPPRSSQPTASTSLPSMWVSCLGNGSSRLRGASSAETARSREEGYLTSLPDHRFTGKRNARCYFKLLNIWVDCHTAIGKGQKKIRYERGAKLWLDSQMWATTCFCKSNAIGTQQCPFTHIWPFSAFVLSWQGWVAGNPVAHKA